MNYVAICNWLAFGLVDLCIGPNNLLTGGMCSNVNRTILTDIIVATRQSATIKLILKRPDSSVFSVRFLSIDAALSIKQLSKRVIVILLACSPEFLNVPPQFSRILWLPDLKPLSEINLIKLSRLLFYPQFSSLFSVFKSLDLLEVPFVCCRR